MKIIDIAKAIAAIDEDDTTVDKQIVVERLDYLHTNLFNIYDSLEDEPE